MSGTLKKREKANNATSFLKVVYQNPFWKSHLAHLGRFRKPTSNCQGVPDYVEVYDVDAIQKLSKHSRTCCASSVYLN